MVQAPSVAAIEALRDPTSIDHQLESLRELKNNIVGHDQRKELVVKNGVIEPLVNILASTGKATGKKRQWSDDKGAVEQPWDQEDEVRLQATIIIGSLASGGPAFVPPLLAARATSLLLDGLAPGNPLKLASASLQAIKSISVSWNQAASIPDSDLDHNGHLELFDIGAISMFSGILEGRRRTQSKEHINRQDVTLVADIIVYAARSDHAKEKLTEHGALDALTALLAAYLTPSESIDTPELRAPPPHTAVPHILEAISTIIQGSTFRAHRFLLSKHVRQLTPLPGDPYPQANVYGSLLPPLHIPTYKSVSFNGGSSAFPVLGILQANNLPDKLLRGPGLSVPDADHENSVIGWLLFLARSFTGRNRLVALRLLTLVNQAIDTNAGGAVTTQHYMQKARERERQLALLAVPLAVKLVQDSSEGKSEDTREQREMSEIKEGACEVLALLIKGSKELQQAAVDAGAIKYMCPVLKKSFDNVPLAKPMWSARGTNTEQTDVPETCKLGSKGLLPEIMHAMRCREGALEALSALARKEDTIRKAIVESGVVSCIIDSLKPFPTDYATKLAMSRGQASPKDGNTTPVILAACHAAQSMSRSVALLRTSLIDAGIAKPIFELLEHTDPQVQIAATDVCCNLLMDFSPMREDLIAAGVIKPLCKHARQSSVALRLSSLWALKHMVMSSSREVRISTLEDLGTGWLVGAIEGEQRDNAPVSAGGGVSVGLSTSNAAGEQVDLLNPSSMDVDQAHDDNGLDEMDDEDGEEEEEDDGELMYDEPSDTHYHSSQLRSTLKPTSGYSKSYLESFRLRDSDPALQAKRDDMAVQEQALDFVRNLLNGPDDCAYMLDHVLEQFGTNKFFELLNAKFAPLPTGHGRQAGQRPMYQPTELILSAVNVLTHVANGSSKQKQLLIAQKQLLQVCGKG